MKTQNSKVKVATQKTTSIKSESKVVKKEATVKVIKKDIKVDANKKAEEVKKGVSLKVAIVGVDGASKGTIALSEEVFGVEPNKALIAQAVRVYLANQRQGNASTKTRSDVTGSTRKIYRQKGTGRARHGAIKAPIFVGGGVAHGPHPHDFSLKMPVKMRKKALISALSKKAQEGALRVVEGDFSGKTKEVVKLLHTLALGKNGKANKVLFVVDKNENAARAAHNIDGLLLEKADTLTTYGVMVNRNIIFLKNAVDEVTKRLKI